ncbi:hypothetical protein LTR36_005464 [Oleoguttula mirabilis]|uniref:Aminoglycoside phosphotransferase domain-containing protein n=1 Tax=Oleoguttula mirabilis TaxID=1507867 RepID=A0AAV9JEC8_9PEZI|nr:hypothetical protein LTR36_005464 [Oleoguttula mirabilis]
MEDQTLPTIAEILASTHFLSHPDSDTKVVKVGEQFAVKYGSRVTLLEAENMEYLANTAVPAPKVYASMKDPEEDRLFIIMEFIEGETLEAALPSLTSAECDSVFDQIRRALIHMRSFPPPDYLGSSGRRPYLDGIFFSDPVDPKTSGPFADEDEMNEGMLRRLAQECVPSHVRLLRTIVESTLQGHRTVFTHADLQPKNILVSRVGSKADGTGGVVEVKIVDWEMSGWYPEYWEFCSASVWEGSKPEWLDAVQDMMVVYPKEFLMVKLIRNTVFLLGG